MREALAEKRVLPRITLTLPPAQPGGQPRVAALENATVALVRPATRPTVPADGRSGNGDTVPGEEIAFVYESIKFRY